MKKLLTSLIVLSQMLFSVQAADDLKAYYETQKAELISTFTTPELGSDVEIMLSTGRSRKGILMKLSADSVALMTETGMVTYKRSMLKESSRASFFAEDFAHVKAMEKTREFKEKAHLERVEENASNTHEGRISVSAKIEKSAEKDVEEEDRENEKSGNTTTITTTTKTYTEIQQLSVTIANNTTHPDTYTLAWYFIGQTLEGEAVSVHDEGTAKVTVKGRSRVQKNASSEPFIVTKTAQNMTSANSNTSRDARTSETGKESAGWLVVLKYGNEIMDTKASSKTYLSEDWLRKIQ